MEVMRRVNCNRDGLLPFTKLSSWQLRSADLVLGRWWCSLGLNGANFAGLWAANSHTTSQRDWQQTNQRRPTHQTQNRKHSPQSRQKRKVCYFTIAALRIENTLSHILGSCERLTLRSSHRRNIMNVALAVCAKATLVIALHLLPVGCAALLDGPR